MITGEIAFGFTTDEFHGTDISQILGEAEHLTREKNTHSRIGMEGLRSFLAPHFSLEVKDFLSMNYLHIALQIRDYDKDTPLRHEEVLTALMAEYLGSLDDDLAKRVASDYAGLGVFGQNNYTLAPIPPTVESVTAIQEMIHEDLKAAGNKHPEVTADPTNPRLRDEFEKGLTDNAEGFVGAYVEDELMAFVYAAPCRVGTRTAIHGLAARRSLYTGERARVLGDLIDFATFQAQQAEASEEVSIAIHKDDDALVPVLERGFVPTRKTRKNFGMKQRLYNQSIL